MIKAAGRRTRFDFHKLINSIWNKEDCLNSNHCPFKTHVALSFINDNVLFNIRIHIFTSRYADYCAPTPVKLDTSCRIILACLQQSIYALC
jgi:hypothetical protein